LNIARQWLTAGSVICNGPNFLSLKEMNASIGSPKVAEKQCNRICRLAKNQLRNEFLVRT